MSELEVVKRVEWTKPLAYPPYTLLEVDPKRLRDRAERKEFSPDAEKLRRAFEWLREQPTMEAPVVARYLDGIGFINGHHRTLAAVQLGFSSIKIAVFPKEVSFIKNFFF